MATARFSCGMTSGVGTLALDCLARLKASTIGGKSVPGIGEEIIDAVVGQRAEEGLSGDRRAFVALGALRLGSHEVLSFVRGVVRL